MFFLKTAQIIRLTICLVLIGGSATTQASQENHEHHHHGGTANVVRAETVSPIEILMPGNNDVVGRQLAVVITTPADLDVMTMGAGKVGVHLHLEIDGVSLMPTRQQLVDLGSNRYVFLFDLPAKPGPNTVKVFWADAEHKIIESSVRSVLVNVRP